MHLALPPVRTRMGLLVMRPTVAAFGLGFTLTYMLGYLFNVCLGLPWLNGLHYMRPIGPDFLFGLACGVAAGQVAQILLRKPKKDTV